MLAWPRPSGQWLWAYDFVAHGMKMWAALRRPAAPGSPARRAAGRNRPAGAPAGSFYKRSRAPHDGGARLRFAYGEALVNGKVHLLKLWKYPIYGQKLFPRSTEK